MKERIPCLLRIGDNVKKHKYLFLEQDQVTIGRSPEVTHCILSVMISRCHAIVKKQVDGKWSITDNKSLNGVYVNGKKLEAQVARVLNPGDMVQLGIPVESGQPAEFIYQFHDNLKVKRVRKDSPEEHIPAKKRLKTQVTTGNLDKTSPKKTCDEKSTGNSAQEASPYKSYKLKLETYQKEQSAAMVGVQAQLEELQKQLREKEQEQERMKEQLEHEKQERENQADQIKQKEEDMKQELLTKQELMRKEKEEMEEKMQKELESKLKERETQLTEYLFNQRNSLIDEKQRVEECLQKEMEKAMEEKDKKLEEELMKQKEQLANVIAEKELKQKMLESQLQATKAENEKQKETTLRAREDVLANFTDLMETELQCSICNELFVKATSLNCSHAFCALCINQWMERKKDCPVCRTKVTSHVHSIVLDSYIDKMVEHLSDDLKKSRQELVQTRKEEQAKWDETHKATTSGRRLPIVIDSDSDEDDEDDEDEDDIDRSDLDSSTHSGSESEEGYSYYGGYGRCYNCGKRGHWANGCPRR